MCTLELLSAHKIEAFKGMRREEVGLLVQTLKLESTLALDSCDDQWKGVAAAVDVTDKVHATSADMSCRMVFGKKFMDDKEFEGFKAVIQQGMQLGATSNIGILCTRVYILISHSLTLTVFLIQIYIGYIILIPAFCKVFYLCSILCDNFLFVDR